MADDDLKYTLNALNSTLQTVSSMLGGNFGMPNQHYAPTAGQVLWGKQQAQWTKAYYEDVGAMDPRAAMLTTWLGRTFAGDNFEEFAQNIAPSLQPLVSRGINMPGISKYVGGSIHDLGMGVATAVGYSGMSVRDVGQQGSSTFLGPGPTTNAMSLSVMRETMRHFFTEEGLSRPDRAQGFNFSEMGEIYGLMRDRGSFSGMELGQLVDNGSGTTVPVLNRDTIKQINEQVQSTAETLRAVRDITNLQSVQDLARVAETFTGANIGRGSGSRLALQRLTGYAASAEAAGMDARRYLEVGTEIGNYMRMFNPGNATMNKELTSSIMSRLAPTISMNRGIGRLVGDDTIMPGEADTAAWMTQRVAEESGQGGANQMLFAAEYIRTTAPRGSDAYRASERLLSAYQDRSLTETERRRRVMQHAAEGGLSGYINEAGGIDTLMNVMSAEGKDRISGMISENIEAKAQSDWLIASSMLARRNLQGTGYERSSDELRNLMTNLAGGGRGLAGSDQILRAYAGQDRDVIAGLTGLDDSLRRQLEQYASSGGGREALEAVRQSMLLGGRAVNYVGTASDKQREEAAQRELFSNTVWASTGDGPAPGLMDSVVWGLIGKNQMPAQQAASIAVAAGMGVNLASSDSVRKWLVSSGTLTEEEAAAFTARHERQGSLSAIGMKELQNIMRGSHSFFAINDAKNQSDWLRFLDEAKDGGTASQELIDSVTAMAKTIDPATFTANGFSDADDFVTKLLAETDDKKRSAYGSLLSTALASGKVSMYAVRNQDMDVVRDMQPKWEMFQSLRDGDVISKGGPSIASIMGISAEEMSAADLNNVDSYKDWYQQHVVNADKSQIEERMKRQVLGRTRMDGSAAMQLFSGSEFTGMLQNMSSFIDERLSNKDLTAESRATLEHNKKVIGTVMDGKTAGNYIGRLLVEGGNLFMDMFNQNKPAEVKGGN